MNTNVSKFEIWAHRMSPLLLRVGMSLVILWFGVEQVIDTQSWIGFLPAWTASWPLPPETLVHINGYFEIIFGVFMLAGFYTRLSAFLLSIHLFDIAYIVGFDALGVRDFGLAVATFVVFLNGKHDFSADTWYSPKPLDSRNLGV